MCFLSLFSFKKSIIVLEKLLTIVLARKWSDFLTSPTRCFFPYFFFADIDTILWVDGGKSMTSILPFRPPLYIPHRGLKDSNCARLAPFVLLWGIGENRGHFFPPATF